MSTLTASVSSRARATLRGRVWPSLWHPAQRGELWSLPGWAGGQPGQRLAEFRSSSREPCVLPGGGSPWERARVGAGMGVSVQVASMVWAVLRPTRQVSDPGSAAGERYVPRCVGWSRLREEPAFKPQAPSRGRRPGKITAHTYCPHPTALVPSTRSRVCNVRPGSAQRQLTWDCSRKVLQRKLPPLGLAKPLRFSGCCLHCGLEVAPPLLLPRAEVVGPAAVSIPALAPAGWVAVGQSPHLSGPQFLHPFLYRAHLRLKWRQTSIK